MRCDICSFDSSGSFAPDIEYHLKTFLDKGRVYITFNSMDNITQAIARGCWICRTIRDALLSFNRHIHLKWHCNHNARDRDFSGKCQKCITVHSVQLNFHADPSCGMVIATENLSPGEDRQEAFCIIGNGIPWPGGLKPPPASRTEYLSNLTQHSRLDQARAWLEKCTLEHSGCQQSSCSPKRLLEIRDIRSTLDDQPSVKLCSPGDSVKKYACLSYCWGGTGNLKTLVDNLQRHFHSISFSDLPKTIQDAVRICLALRIYYLWVDALCIVQDDENDWASECMRMGGIYSGAHVTLAAVQGRDSEAGLLPFKPFEVARIKVWPPTGSPTEALVYRQPQHSYPDHLFYEQHREQRPLLTRGWVYQELLLSPRVLRFDADELSFECREGMMCECRLPANARSSEPFAARRRDFSLVENGLLSHSDAFTLWYNMVKQYSSMSLTKQSDRLPAFSAIASKFSRYGGRYYAGIWQNDFIYGLQWRVENWAIHRRTSSTGTTPSWSWTSQPDPVAYEDVKGDPSYIAKISIKILALSNAANIFGGVSKGYLDASSLLKPVKLAVNPDPFSGPYKLYELDGSGTDEFGYTRIMFYADCGIPRELKAKLLRTPNSVCCFLLIKTQHRVCDHTYSLVLGLIDEKQRLYRRIGFMHESYSERSWFDDAKEARILIE